jgi:hypothetical protein
MKKFMLHIAICTAVLVLGVVVIGCQGDPGKDEPGLAGAWRGKVPGTSGWLASMKGLEFMYVFHPDGTMTESSNYDAFPPGPPAYGVWRRIGVRHYEARYEVFLTKPVAILDEIAKGGGWVPNGYGVLTQNITLSENGKVFESTIRFDLFDADGKPVEGGGEATGHGERIAF